ncbi:transcriptional repressor [Limibaculum sp. M0105]|uniref:Transcriptional repressor n=1 Tax=Thermohalobaculum xanthum TaxID=2753746 RepID=A0A8J7SCT9_9RHOB|nr:Fur family transcriptional regulator [Thermohalobaculum xanthum]MBK0398446.1 transcriptional repressor [Thermohalobaculum xanthum]
MDEADGPRGSAGSVAFAPHDHARCRRAAIEDAQAHCKTAGLRLTPVRERVLEILLESHVALGAYDVLRRLTDEGAVPQPPIAYRALDFLVAHGFAHRIEKLNAYVACTAPCERHDPVFMICRDCRAVAELPSAPIARDLEREAARIGFDIGRTVVEAEGLCPSCRVGETA